MKILVSVIVAILTLMPLTGCQKNTEERAEVYDPQLDGATAPALNIPNDQLAARMVREGKAIAVQDDRITEEVAAPLAEAPVTPEAGAEMPAAGGATADPNNF